ncbi:MAG: PP2C family protein-serine/threonine phosphatase [Defluviitaleaceae bacterium]|nr:PP2C family protein-serine/threonine phosphatase [Defluviitaleaceae bacterium]
MESKVGNSLMRKAAITIFTAVLFFVVNMPLRELFVVLDGIEMRPASALPPVLGLMLGVPGALGCALGNLLGDILSGHSPNIFVPGFFAQFAYGVIPILLWRVVRHFDKTAPAVIRLNHAKNAARYMVIILINSVIMAGLLGGIMQAVGVGELFSMGTLMVLLNNFVFCMVLGIPIIVFITILRLKTTQSGLSLNEKMVLMFMLLRVFSAALTGVIAYTELSQAIEDPLMMWNRIFLYIAGDVFIFYIITAVFLWYCEKNIALPVETISGIAKNYVSQECGKKDSQAVVAEFESLTRSRSETGILAEAFKTMVLDLDAYIKNLTAVTAEKERIGAELDVATHIQASMLPRKFPAFPGRNEFDIFASMKPAKEVGGDFYDFFMVDEDTLAVVIADVSGKGVPAALFMVIAKTLIKNTSQQGKSPKEIFETVNNLLCENNDASMFVTAFYGHLHISTGRFTFVNAGHNPPIILKNGKFDWLKQKAGFVLAIMEDMAYIQHEITLEVGDELFLYTDGIVEAMNNEEELFGDDRLYDAMQEYRGLTLHELAESVNREVDKFEDGAEQADDITMLVLRYKGMTLS